MEKNTIYIVIKLNDKKGMLRYLNIAVALNENNTNATALLNDELKNL